jgi:hypothetical protein
MLLLVAPDLLRLSRFGFGVMSGDILFLHRPDRHRSCSPLAWWFVLGLLLSQFRSAGLGSTLVAVWLVVMVLLIPASCCCWFCVNWKKTCKATSKGGMGFKDLRAFNEALLAKQGWRLVTNPTSLVARILKAKYYPNCEFLKAKQPHTTSYSWQSIHKASWLLKKGCFWNIGDGASINIWTDRWIHTHFGSTTWSKKPADTPFKW